MKKGTVEFDMDTALLENKLLFDLTAALLLVPSKISEVHLHVDLKEVRTLVMTSWQFDETPKGEERFIQNIWGGVTVSGTGIMSRERNQCPKCYYAP